MRTRKFNQIIIYHCSLQSSDIDEVWEEMKDSRQDLGVASNLKIEEFIVYFNSLFVQKEETLTSTSYERVNLGKMKKLKVPNKLRIQI